MFSDYSLKELAMQILYLPRDVANRFKTDRLTRHAAALSFSSLLALAPMMAIILAMLSLFASFEQMGAQLESFIYQSLAPAAGDDLKLYIEQFAGQAGKLTVIGLLFFLLTALLLLFNIEESFNDIWRVKHGRTIVARLTIYWALITLGPLLMGASLAVSTYVLSIQVLQDVNVLAGIRSIVLSVLPFLLETVAFLMLYLIMPHAIVRIRHAALGAAVAAILFAIAKKCFVVYVSNFANYEVVYGALSTLPIFLIWIYVSWVVALVGATVVAIFHERAGQAKERAEDIRIEE
jgi:membrane protein